ncbi:hypothetical protein [Streptomyces decoyicus]|uniref:hypothetical protein n=1 Tax=Streptomyces decoyicus TaxID=249567 RepID=UPI00069E2986|nr:hypothetical protein [Streptomyces decoyicus]KOG39706.1 hypothetical protein ADK74_27525 [Streptomyces decoyicus]QZY16366.1 hypothetical protein K7C20_14810 [Streptomyces decoyicus]
MSVTTVVLLSAAAVAVALGVAALHTARALRRQIAELHAELTAARQDAVADAEAVHPALATIPAARPTPAAETPLADIRAAVADALAEERERELAEARAFWAAQEARDAADAPSLLGGLVGLGDEGLLDARADRELPERQEPDRLDIQPFLPRQADLAGLEPLLGSDAMEAMDALESMDALDAPELEPVEETESAELAAARRRHPSHPDFSPPPVISDHERTVARLEELAQQATPLADVRPGPLGTLDVYVFTDGTTLCLTPGQRETAERVAGALHAGHAPVLLGGSGISGAYALTFAWGESREESVYILADRVIASL